MTKLSTADVTNEIEGRLDGLKHSVKELLDHGIADRAGAVKDSAMNGVEYVGSQIKKHPIAALAIAFGIGYLAMRMIRR
ncbi:MAG: hypothetical protein ABI591_11405 [Kofleriaceae bacterium]